MLILSRKCQEQIVIGDQISITVLSTANGRVKIGVQAPQDVLIRRCEPKGLSQNCEIEGFCTESDDLIPGFVLASKDDVVRGARTMMSHSLDCGPVLVPETKTVAS